MNARSLLADCGLTATRPRVMIVEALARSTDAVTAQQLHRRLLRRASPPGLATVYRTLTSLAEAGAIDTLQTGTEVAFRMCSDGHHHHLVCDGCGDVREIRSKQIERWVAQVADTHGYEPTGHTAEVRGVCPSCRTS